MIAIPIVRRHPKDTEPSERRRSFLLSLTLHLALLYIFIYLQSLPKPTPPTESYLVIDLGIPAKGEVSLAATVSEPAPQGDAVEVADNNIGTPQSSTPAPAEEATPQTSPEIAASSAPQVTPTTEVTTANNTAETSPPPSPSTPASSSVETASEVRVAAATSIPTPQVQRNALQPREIPTPQAEASVSETQVVPTPQVITSAVATLNVPTPQVQASVTEAQSVPTPQVQASVAEARSVPKPQAQSSVAEARSVPKPTAQSSLAEARSVPTPQVQSSVTEAQAVPTPQVNASLATSQAVPTPQVNATVASAQAVPTPQVNTSLATSQTVPTPQVNATVATAQAVPTPQVNTSLAVSQTVPTPQVNATVATATAEATESLSSPQVQVAVNAPQTASRTTGEATGQNQEAEATTGNPNSQTGPESPATGPNNNRNTAGPSQGNNPTGNANARQSDGPQGGDGPTPRQTANADNPNLDNRGAASQPNGSNQPTGAPRPPAEPFRERLERPLAVMVDNVGGYPQRGFKEASAIYEMPVEGGYTRLMMVFDRSNPSSVGPVRSARDYFHTLSEGLGGILVHDGGSPAALQQIAKSNTPTFNAYSSGELFARESSRSAPYNLYSTGTKLREAINRLNLNSSRTLSGTMYRPDEGLPETEQNTAYNTGAYKSSFRYISNLNLYQWQRNGSNASDAYGESVLVDAVVVAKTAVQKIPGDNAGRLYVSLSGGNATLYLRGKEVQGRWSREGGFSFYSSSGDKVDLTPFKHWVVFSSP